LEFDKSAPVELEKTKTMKEICRFLLDNPKTQITAIRGAIKTQLHVRGKIGDLTKRQGNATWTINVDMHDDDYLLINECIYDLLYARVITPGVHAHNLDLPFIHVSDKEKLQQYL